MRRAQVVLNARVTRRATITGVERWAHEVIPRLLSRAPERYVAATPPPAASSGPLGYAWEQLLLPLLAARARAKVIFSPANLAPLGWPGNVLMLHDATVLREPEAYSRAYRAWHRTVGIRGARQALMVLTVSEFSRRELVELADLDPQRVRVVSGGVDSRFTPDADHQRVAKKLGLNAPYVLTVATRDERKNLSTLGFAAEALARDGIELVWAGDERPQFSRNADLDAVRRLGYVDDGDLPGLYCGASAFVLPSRYEGLGLPCLEAMACGTPVVAANRGALPETCGDAALLVDPDDPEAVCQALFQAIGDSVVRTRLQEAGLQRVAPRTWDRATGQIDDMLVELLSI
jgi:glycosyltransferase involved in cell wall biosynthesis